MYCEGGAHLLGRDAAGKSVPRNYELAFQNTLRAAEKGNASAQTAVGMMYANGTGVEQNYAEAAKWWVKAAEGGHLAAANLTAMVYRGEGGPRDRQLADKWAKIVAERASAAPAQ